MEKVENIISILILIFISGIASIIFYESYYSTKFAKTKIKISFELLKKDWGNPDRIIENRGGDKTVFYNTILNEFVFNIDEKELVEFKYKDNF